MELNINQKKAVEIIEGPLLIIAGPGSGKTKTLIERVSNMVDNGIKLENILISTFTERAAQEIKTRLNQKIDTTLNSLYIGTIHSICLKIIDKYIEKSYLKRGYTIFENIDQKFFIFSKLRELKKIDGYEEYIRDKGHYNTWKLVGHFQNWLNKISEEAKDENELIRSSNFKLSFLGKVYKEYKKLLFEDNKIDFSMIQVETYRILLENEEILEKVQDEIKYLMIDEYQDTNHVQELLIFLIGGEKKNICVVGDDDQGIYRFRGATIKNILNFPKKIENCQIVKLETNYRSEKDIIDFNFKWIDSLKWENFRHEKNLVVSENKTSLDKRVVKLSVKNSEKDWQIKIVNFLKFMKKQNKISDYNQVAFLFNSVRNSKVKNLANVLEENRIGVYSPRSNLFFMRKEIKKIIGAMLYVLTDRKSEFYYPQIMSDIVDYYRKCYDSFEKEIEEFEDFKNEILEIKEKYLKEFQLEGGLINIFYEIINLDIFKNILDIDTEDLLESRELYNLGIFSKIVEKIDNISKINYITDKNIKKLVDYFFLMHLKLLKNSGVDEYEDIKEFAPSGAVSFLTIHQSKGLEFPIVIVGSLENTPDKSRNEDEELDRAFKWDNFEPHHRIKEFDFWRLYYVAFSRAKDLLILTTTEVETSKKIVPSLPFKRVYDELPDMVYAIREKSLDFENLNISKIHDINLKESYSYTSHYLKYEECPFKYRLNKIFDFVKPKNRATFYGNLLHDTLEKVNKKILEKDSFSNEDLKDIFNENYEVLSKNEGIKLKEEILSVGLNQIQNYFKTGKDIIENIVSVEKEMGLTHNNYLIEGKADLIIEKDNELYIVDFKTGELDEERLDAYKTQIQVYCMLLENELNKKVAGGILYFIKNNKEVEVLYNREEKNRVLDSFDDVIKNIESKNFTEKRKEKKKCSKCEFKRHCFGINVI